MNKTEKILRENVQRGVQLLDQKKPGWAKRIDLGKLEMSDFCGCIIGQIFINYCEGLIALELEYRDYEEIDYGFELPQDCLEREESWSLLDSIWKEEITKRRLNHGS